MRAVDLAARELAALQAADRAECATNPVAFIERHCKIEEPDGRVLPFRLWNFQKRTTSTLVDTELAIILKARRLGLSWLALSLALWYAIFQQHIRILILCKNEQDAAELLDRIRRMRDRISNDPASKHVLAGIRKPPKHRDAVTTLDIGESTIRALVGTPAAARSETAGLVIWDEAAFQAHADAIWQGLLPTIEGGGRLWVISTGNRRVGRGATFAVLWQRAQAGLNNFAALFWPWDARPDRTTGWYADTLKSLGSEAAMRAEYPAVPDDAFAGEDGTPVYSPDGIAAAVRLGTKYDRMRADGTMAPPVGARLPLGADFGEHSHTLLAWPLETGGVYIISEHHWEHGEPDREANRVIPLIQAAGWPLERFRFDASKPESARLFWRELRAHEETRPPRDPIARRPRTLAGQTTNDGPVPVPFGEPGRHGRSLKRVSILYLRRLFNRAAANEPAGVIAISPTCRLLIEQLEGLRFKDDQSGDVVKQDDHGPDALIAAVAHYARAWERRADKTD